MYQLWQNYSNDIIIIAILVIEIVILTILGINTLKKSRSLANMYFSGVFFMVVGLSTVNIAIRIFSIYIQNHSLGSGSVIVELYMFLISVVSASMLVIIIIYGAGFYIINFGEKYYREKKKQIVFGILVFIVAGSILGSYLLPDEWGLDFLETPHTGYQENFDISNPLAIFVFLIATIGLIFDLILVIRIYPDVESKIQKRKITQLILAVISYYLGLANLIIVDMQIEVFQWNYIYITSVLFLVSIFLLYFAIIKRKKDII